MRFKLKWDALWAQDATLEQVTAEEREEYINEALLEIASKMKRKHKVKTLSNFEILERVEEHVHVAYPDIGAAAATATANTTAGQDGASSEDGPTDEELKSLAL